MNKFSERIAELRKEKGLSRRELAENFNLKQSAIYEWEVRGCQTDYDTLIALAKFFEVTTDYLLGLED